MEGLGASDAVEVGHRETLAIKEAEHMAIADLADLEFVSNFHCLVVGTAFDLPGLLHLSLLLWGDGPLRLLAAFGSDGFQVGLDVGVWHRIENLGKSKNLKKAPDDLCPIVVQDIPALSIGPRH